MKWEYNVLFVVRPYLEETMERMADEGWELVCVAGNGSERELYFRREKRGQ